MPFVSSSNSKVSGYGGKAINSMNDLLYTSIISRTDFLWAEQSVGIYEQNTTWMPLRNKRTVPCEQFLKSIVTTILNFEQR